jgi:CRISPR type III-A/MTUBE-associated protein Csm6
MKTALQVIALLGDYDMTPIQVSTPNRAMNSAKEDLVDYNVETRWGLNEDNEPGAENRCAEVQSKNLLALWRKDLIKKYIGVYDYVAACQIADEMGSRLDKDAAGLLRACKCRLKLDLKGVGTALAGLKSEIDISDLFPKLSSDTKNIFEYLLWLDIKLKNEEYADFIRGVTPAADEIYEMLLKSNGISVASYCNTEEYKNASGKIKTRYRLSAEKISRDAEVKAAFAGAYGNIEKSDGRELGSHNLGILLKCKSENKDERDSVERISAFIQEYRNSFAHEIRAVTEEWIKSNGNVPKKIWDALRFLFIRSVKMNKNEYWNAYDAVNREIEKLLA